MSVNRPVVIDYPCLSRAWGAALLYAFDSTDQTRAPIVVSVSNFAGELPPEDAQIRSAVDKELALCAMNSVRVSGMMIFPFDVWCRRGRPACSEYSEFCVHKLLPRLKARDQRNRLGTYFERMMDFTGATHQKVRGVKKQEFKTVNQLTHVIDLLKNPARWARQSALQLACFDPAKDHTRQPVRGFPCLQQVSITHDGTNRIAINAYYPTQYIFDRGYGNYLGLCHLGAFIADQTGLVFSRLNCFVGDPQRGKISKTKLAGLVGLIRKRLGDSPQS